jgi:hypothetical protein
MWTCAPLRGVVPRRIRKGRILLELTNNCAIPMRIVSWNLGHQTREAPISDSLGEVLLALRPDVVVLNEFVDGPSRVDLRSMLQRLGMPHVQVSERIGRHNQVLIASSEPTVAGDLQGPSLTGGAGESNFLHLRFDSGYELVGVRVPTYQRLELTQYWEQLVALIRSTNGRKIAWIGDFNADPDNPRSFGGRFLSQLESEGWVIPRATGAWSFWRGSRIDHLLVSPSLACSAAEYVVTVKGRTIAGQRSQEHISDHAALLGTVTASPVMLNRPSAIDGQAS